MINTDGRHKHPASLNLSNTQKGINPGSLPSGLAEARIIKDLVSGEYHELETRAQYRCEGWQVLVYKFDPRKISLLLFIVVTIAISCCSSYLSAKTSQTTFSFGFHWAGACGSIAACHVPWRFWPKGSQRCGSSCPQPSTLRFRRSGHQPLWWQGQLQCDGLIRRRSCCKVQQGAFPPSSSRSKHSHQCYQPVQARPRCHVLCWLELRSNAWHPQRDQAPQQEAIAIWLRCAFADAHRC
jgi:hypothetical protein